MAPRVDCPPYRWRVSHQHAWQEVDYSLSILEAVVMKRSITAIAVILMMTVCYSGCSDEVSCQLCPPPPSAPELFVIGSASFDGPYTLTVAFDVFNTAGTARRVESAVADDQPLCVRDVPYSTSGDGHQLVRTLGGEYCPTGVILEFSATDTTSFGFYCDSELHSAELHLLDPDDDVPRNLTATADPASATLDISWDPVGDAEWYSLKVRSKFNFSGPWAWDFYVVDSTSITVPLPIPYAQLLDARIYVAACTGARPDAAGNEHNVHGPYMTGNVCSVSNEAYFYLELTPLSAAADESGGEWIAPPSLRELIRLK
jgi:hypothetical protein